MDEIAKRIVMDYIRKTYPESKDATDVKINFVLKNNVAFAKQYIMTCPLYKDVYFSLIYSSAAFAWYLSVFKEQDSQTIDPNLYADILNERN